MRLKSILMLSRPLNLFIVAITMFLTRYVVLVDVLGKGGKEDLALSHLHFTSLVLSALLITAAGNVINDYFDQKVDKINKPEKVIVGKTINRKVAILVHQGLNTLAFLLVFWVSWKTHFWQLLIFPSVITFLLWWYSPIFKKKPLIGNLLVALCTASVPVFAVISDIHILGHSLRNHSHVGMSLYTYAWLWVLGIAAFAFVLTMIREAVKDVQDSPGDSVEQYKTLPIIWGIQLTKRYVLVWMFVFFAMTGWCMSRTDTFNDLIWIASCLALPMAIALIQVMRATTPESFGRVSRWIKWVMVGGLLLILALLQ